MNPPDGSRLSNDALTAIYLEIRPKLERVILRRVGSAALSADLAQEMFFRIGTIKSDLLTRADAERYFMRVAMNASLDHLKIEARRREILQHSTPLVETSTPSPEAAMLTRDDIRIVEDALTELPVKCRDILLLSRIDGFSHAEIAAKLGVSRSLVEKYIVRALVHCRRRLSAQHDRSEGTREK